MIRLSQLFLIVHLIYYINLDVTFIIPCVDSTIVKIVLRYPVINIKMVFIF